VTPFFRDDHLTVYQGDCREVMAAMEPESVHCVVTSPPYWGLRDYGTATWVGGDEGCDHLFSRANDRLMVGSDGKLGRNNTSWTTRDGTAKGGNCPKGCGAVRQDSQLGLEPTPEAFVANMVDVFREVRRVLRKDGTLWLNLGDSYAASGERSNNNGTGATTMGTLNKAAGLRLPRVSHGLKPKDLVGIPWRVAFALQADGWYLRSDIIWSKPNPMPESVTDRPTKAHEYVFLLTKSARYYYDADAVREPHESLDHHLRYPNSRYAETGKWGDNGKSGGVEGGMNPAGRNLRSVWTIATAPYPGAHFATFPRKLVEPCVKAGCPSDGTVLDPFAGSGTTGLVAQSLGRRAVLIDLNGDYLVQAMARNAQTPLGLVG
jgi:DNA modification methylase